MRKMKYWPEPSHKLGAKLVLLTLLCSAILANVSQAQVAPTQRPRSERESEAAFRQVSNRLLCQCGCNYMVLSCNHLECPSATYIRKTIKASLAEGKNEDVIVASFVEQYGAQILPEPPLRGFALMAWVMPFLALLLGGGGVSYVLWQWKWKPQAAQAEAMSGAGEIPDDARQTPASRGQDLEPALVNKYRAQIEEELEQE